MLNKPHGEPQNAGCLQGQKSVCSLFIFLFFKRIFLKIFCFFILFYFYFIFLFFSFFFFLFSFISFVVVNNLDP